MNDLINHVHHDMYNSRMSYALNVMSIYQNDSYDDHWTIVKISLRALEGLRIYYVCWTIVHCKVCYIDTSFVARYNLNLSQFWRYVKVAKCNGRKFHDRFGIVPNGFG